MAMMLKLNFLQNILQKGGGGGWGVMIEAY